MDHFKGKKFNDHLKWTDAMVTTPFFVVQPLALAVEAIVKRQWRAWKLRRLPQWLLDSNKQRQLVTERKAAAGTQDKRTDGSAEPARLVFAERLIGFVWTWVWLGWSARWFVSGLPRSGIFKRVDRQADQWSPVGKWVWDKAHGV